MKDNVNHPDHYTQGGIECIDAIAAATTGKTGIEAVCVANVIKYLWRYELKNGIEDVKKARWYLDRLIDEMPEPAPAKTQMQIVQEGIDRLDALDREAFIQTLVDAGMAEPAATVEPGECPHVWSFDAGSGRQFCRLCDKWRNKP